MIAALFVDPAGVYSKITDIDLWDESRDARLYNGDFPVVGHPPCQLWGNFAKVNFKRWGGEHNRPGNDGGCFKSALENVRRVGGVLEHPAFSKAWKAHGLFEPRLLPDWFRLVSGNGKEWVCEVWQSAYGHPATKRTWLFYCGNTPPPSPRLERLKGTHQIGFHDQRGKAANKPTISGKKASATPPEFAEYLINLAILSRKNQNDK
jgi:hypothetical protein